ncbi:hypothetical protein UPYG_G00007380 [Umbra pygmaea]|uniref:Uncharacterized protein n=1 Tax=Umbra pygmaea TaxID=75934 RepID=A0ABD0XHS1_UMBPY
MGSLVLEGQYDLARWHHLLVRLSRNRKRADAISMSSLADTSSSLTAAQGSSDVKPTTDSEPPDCQEELCTVDLSGVCPLFVRVEYTWLTTKLGLLG